MESDIYKTIKSSSRGIYKEKGSRFTAFAFPITNQEEIKPIIDRLRKENHEDKHHCYAYMLGQARNIWRLNDDGEPSGTGGKPILGQINSYGLTNILIVVCRYFGGTLLGVTGLINAYKTAAQSAIKNSEIIEKTLQEYYRISFPYTSINDVMKILKEEITGQSEQRFDLYCSIKLNFRASSKEEILPRLSRIEGLKFEYIETR